MTESRPLRVFLCHSSNDKPAVRELYQKLHAEAWIQPWLDEEDIFPGDDWNLEIQKAIQETDAIVVCRSKSSITKEGYVQREIKTALDYSDEKPDGTVYIIPIRLEECKPPERLSKWQYADYFEGQRERGLQRLLISLKRRAESLGLKVEPAPVGRVSNPTPTAQPEKSQAKSLTYETPSNKITLSNGMEFMRVPAGKFLMGSRDDHKSAFPHEKPQHTVDIPYDYWMARYPVTNGQYNDYVKAKGIEHPVDDWEKKKDHPVVYVSWKDAMAYCQWLNTLLKGELPAGLVLRLPTEAEWEKTARGTDGREYPWGNEFDISKCNVLLGWLGIFIFAKGAGTSVTQYSPQGDSPYGCADMSGNVWEWTHSLFKLYPYQVNDGREDENVSGAHMVRGGSFFDDRGGARCACRYFSAIGDVGSNKGFRVVASPVLS